MSKVKREAEEGGAIEAPAKGFVLSDFLPYRIVSVGHLISRRLAHAYESENLSIPEWRVLAVIAQADAMAARDVVAQTPLDKMAVSRAVALLESKDLVARRADERDRRVYTLSLTPAGSTMFKRVSQAAMEFERALLAPLSAAERAQFKALLARLEASAAG